MGLRWAKFVWLVSGLLPLYGAGSVQQGGETVVRAASGAVSEYLVSLPHIAYGGAWRTKIVIRNSSASSADIQLFYYGSSGTPVALPFNGLPSNHTDLIIPAYGAQEVEPDWQGAEAVAWAGLLYSNPGLEIQGVFLWHNPADPPDKYTEAAAPVVSRVNMSCVVPLPSDATSQTMPFDETEGRFSGYGFTNTTADPVTLTLKFYGQSGQLLGQTSQQFAGFSHDQFLLRDKVPAVLGNKGVMVIGGTGMVPLGFRFTPYFTFTTWLP